MERRTKKIIERADVVPTTTMTADQACNEFQLVGTTRTHVLKKFADKTYSVNDWTRIFREQRVIT
jgi:hypothetical protein